MIHFLNYFSDEEINVNFVPDSEPCKGNPLDVILQVASLPEEPMVPRDACLTYHISPNVSQNLRMIFHLVPGVSC